MEGLTSADPQAVGEFRLRARLGAGGMGQVFLATSPGGRMVAVKIIHPELARDPDFVRRFHAEVDAARRVSGMYTAPVVAAGVDDRSPWLATAFVPGPSLEAVVSRYGPLPVPALWRLAAGLADALRAIHSAGLVHRDLKPANVLLAADGPRVIDFGIARVLAESRLTATGSVIGTPSFMSPEQVEGSAAGPPSDVFSLGSVLAFAATGASPFRAGPGGSSASVMYRIVHGSPELGTVPAEVRELVSACLAKEPAWRPDPGQVAARCAAAAEYLGLSPAAFWPAEVARVIDAQQAAMVAAVEALPATPPAQVPVFHGAPAPAPGTGARAAPGPAAAAGWPQAASSGLGSLSPAGVTGPARQGVQPNGGGTHRSPRRSPGAVSRRGLFIGAGAAAVVVAGGAGAWVIGSRPPASTPQARGHDEPTGQSPGAGAGGTGTGTGGGTGPGSTAWTFTTGNQVLANPGVANGVAYVGSKDDYVYAVIAATGKQAWKTQLGWVTAAPEVVGDMVCVSTTTGQFSALRVASGAVAWQQQTDVAAAFKRSWASDGDTVILPSVTQPLQAYNVATGSAQQTFGTQSQYTGGVIATANGVLYALSESGALQAFRISTGASLWNAQAFSSGAGTTGTGLIVTGGVIYVATDSGTLYSLNAATGHPNWSYPAGGTLLSDPVAAGGMVYVVDDGGTLHAITAASGKQAWTHVAVSSAEIGPAVSDGTLYISTGLALQALDAKSGNAVWSYTPPNSGALVSTPAAAGGLVFIGSTNDNLYAIRA
jgi:outer membrane protein assembly factor BamB